MQTRISKHCFSYQNLHLTCKYLSCRAAGDSEIISDASLNAPDAFFSPSAAITYQKDQILCCRFLAKSLSYLLQTTRAGKP